MSGIQKVESGVQRAEHTIPIDIHYNKLLEWLVDRKKVPVDWKKPLAVIRVKIGEAIADLPKTEEIQKFIEGKELNYYDCVKMLTLLKESGESDAKNFFGGYSSKRMKDWSDIIKFYEKDNIYLAEASHILMNLINYDLPSFKKSSEQARKQAEDMERKQSEWEKNLVSYQQKYSQSIQELNIQGTDIKNEIIQLQTEIPSKLGAIVTQVKESNILEAIKYYEDFNKYTASTGDKSIDNTTLLPTLKSIIQLEISTTQESNESPVDTEAPSSIEIDWTVIDTKDIEVTPVTDNINWDITVENEEEASTSSSIVWDIEDNTNIEVVDSSIASLPQNTTNLTATSTSSSNTLENNQTRIQFIDDILELREFLQQRKNELSSKEAMAVNLFQNNSSSNSGSSTSEQSTSNATLENVNDWLKTVQNIVSSLNNPRLQTLLEIKSSQRFVDRLAASIQNIVECTAKCKNNILFATHKQQELHKTAADVYPQQEKCINNIKLLRQNIANSLSAQYNSRIVNIYVPV